MTTTVVLGDEYDDKLRRKVMNVTRGLGATILDRSWGVAGSQEVETVVICWNGRDLTIEAETYMGLSVSGETDLVEEFLRLVSEAMAADATPSA